MSYSPNLPIGSAWKSTLTLAFQTLRRIKFIIESDFVFSDFNPQTNFNGMTVTNYDAARCRIFVLNKVAFVSINIVATLAAPFASSIVVSLPENIVSSLGVSQRGATQIANAGVDEVGNWTISAESNQITFSRNPVGTNFSAGQANIRVNTFFEIR